MAQYEQRDNSEIKDLKKSFYYDPSTGVFTRIKNVSQCKIGDVAGSLMKIGYLRISFKNKSYLAHRLAWLYMTGKLPKNEIDHINGIKTDNRWCNLREATRSENSMNKPIQKNNTSNFPGVSFIKSTKKWRAYAKLNKKQIWLGSYETALKAYEVYKEFTMKHFGDFYKEKLNG